MALSHLAFQWNGNTRLSTSYVSVMETDIALQQDSDLVLAALRHTGDLFGEGLMMAVGFKQINGERGGEDRHR